MSELMVILRLFAVFASVIGAGIGLWAGILKLETAKKRKKLTEDELSAKFISQFNVREVEKALSGYVIPHCSPSDPTNREGEEYLADTRESIFAYMDRNISTLTRSYHILLADTGMGKTSFCLNYYAHCKKKHTNYNASLISLSAGNPDHAIRSISNKSETILIADAFDEDPKALANGRDRLSEILALASDFRMVIITCRSQYFLADDQIPRETPLPVLVPRQLGQSPTFSLVRSYISPFDKKEVSAYITKHFPLILFWRIPSRKRAKELADSIPDLAYRPMLLERLPDLAKRPTKTTELYDLYDLLVEGWLTRESRWIEANKLLQVSQELALIIYAQQQSRRGRLTVDEIQSIAIDKVGINPDWKHLTARSLLNRDSKGYYKFSHKSILEFLIVKLAAAGDERALSLRWTSFMKELFVSWGHSDQSVEAIDRARRILASNVGRANVAPLCDMLGTSAVNGYPNFRRCTERRFASTGERLAPAAWRATSIEVHNLKGRGVVTIDDPEYNLVWSYIGARSTGAGGPQIRLVEALNFDQSRNGYRLPSFEQFVTLVEGLHRAGKEVIPNGKLFLLEDKPGRYLHLLAQINTEIYLNPALKCVDKQRKINDTNVYINCYVTGLVHSRDYATRVKVDQLYIHEELGEFDFAGIPSTAPRP